MSDLENRGEAAGPVLVAEAGRLPPIRMLPVVVGLTLLFAIVAILVPFTSQSPLGVAIQTVIFLLTVGFILLSPNGDRLEIFRVASFFFVFSFCIGDLFNPRRVVWYYNSSYDDLLIRTSSLALLCFVMMIIAYYLPVFRRVPGVIYARHDRIDPMRLIPLSLAFYFIGLVCFAIFFSSAGGADVILRGAGEKNRGSFGEGVGIYFWPSLWMTSGGVLYFAATAVRRKRFKWLGAWPLALEFLLLATLQGRQRALGPLLMALVVGHYLIRPIRLPRLAVFAAIAISFAMFVSVARQPSFRSVAASDPTAVFAYVMENSWEHFRGVMTQDIGCVSKAMIIVDKVPTERPYAKGETLLLTLSPVWRLLGWYHLNRRLVGEEAYARARPELNLTVDAGTGILPSLIGEVRWNFPWPIAAIWFFLYGLGLRLIYQRLIVNRSDYASVAIYAVLGLYIVQMIYHSPTQNVFELVDVIVPMFVIRLLSQRPGARAALPVLSPRTTTHGVEEPLRSESVV